MITRRTFGRLGIGVVAIGGFGSSNAFGLGTDSVLETEIDSNDIRRVGVRKSSVYWGINSEKIDLLSGNLSYSVLLAHAGAESCNVALRLSFNSQIWRRGYKEVKAYGKDLGFGYGWKLQIGSITPSSIGASRAFIYTDNTGAEYHLRQCGDVWRSIGATHITFDPSRSQLWFANGTSMIFGAVAGPMEPDAGSLYPTVVQDLAGHRVLISYLPGSGSKLRNTSGRISQIDNVVDGKFGYQFIYNSDPLPRLTSIVNRLGGRSDCYRFSYLQQYVISPFNLLAHKGYPVVLLNATSAGADGGQTFEYNLYGELTRAKIADGSSLEWNYRTFNFQNGRSVREVLTRASVGPTASTTHSFSRSASDGSGTIHNSAIVTEPIGDQRSSWTFADDVRSPYSYHTLTSPSLGGGTVGRRRHFDWVATQRTFANLSRNASVLL